MVAVQKCFGVCCFVPSSKLTSKCSARSLLFCFPVFEVMVPKVRTENFHKLLYSSGFLIGLDYSGSDSANTTIRSAQDAVLYPKHRAMTRVLNSKGRTTTTKSAPGISTSMSSWVSETKEHLIPTYHGFSSKNLRQLSSNWSRHRL